MVQLNGTMNAECELVNLNLRIFELILLLNVYFYLLFTIIYYCFSLCWRKRDVMYANAMPILGMTGS